MEETHYKLALIAGLVLLATVLGVLALYSHTIMPGLKKTDDVTFVQSFQAIDRQIVNPVFMLQFFAPLFILGFAAYYAARNHVAGAPYVIAALVCYAVAVAITMAVNVPLNDGIKKVADAAQSGIAADARTHFNEMKWALFNNIRMVFTMLATAFSAVALWLFK